jgi:hypothetical protein
MNLMTTLLFYLVFGSAVAVAVYLACEREGTLQRSFRTLTAVVFWPLYLPTLLQDRGRCRTEPNSLSNSPSAGEQVSANDEISAAIRQVETELDLALTSLGGWSDAVLAREQHRFEELRLTWHTQADKIRELDRILSQLAASESPVEPPSASARDRVANSLRARQANLGRLHELRDRLHTDLLSTLAWVRELVTMIHLAKYTGAPASRAEELVMQIATSVEGLSQVAAWRDEESSDREVAASF